jgi:hypothetical protein
VPVWDLPSSMTAADCEQPAAAFRARLDEALAQSAPLTVQERKSRGDLVNRQVTIG